MKPIALSPSALKAYLKCPRRWWLEFVARAERIVPSYVTAGTALDQVVQDYLKNGAEPVHLPMGSPELAELESLRAELPAPLTVLVQHKFMLPCPGLEGLVNITTGGLDYLTPPNLDLMVIGDLKRVWHKDAAMSPEQLAADEQAQLYAWLVWRVYNPAEIVWRWTYCVRETRNAQSGKVTRKAKSFSVDVKADRAAVEAWFDRVVLPAARAMLEIRDAARAAEAVEHDPTSCEEGARCFVRHHCPMYQGPVKGDNNMVDLSRFKTGARPAINPPAPVAATQRARAEEALAARNWAGLGLVLAEAQNAPPLGAADGSLDEETWTRMRDACAAAQAAERTLLSVTTIEGPGAALLEAVEEESNAERATEPAPAPELLSTEAKPARRRRGRAEKQAIEAHEAEVVAPPSVESATTEALVWELRDRGYRVTLESGAL